MFHIPNLWFSPATMLFRNYLHVGLLHRHWNTCTTPRLLRLTSWLHDLVFHVCMCVSSLTDWGRTCTSWSSCPGWERLAPTRSKEALPWHAWSTWAERSALGASSLPCPATSTVSSGGPHPPPKDLASSQEREKAIKMCVCVCVLEGGGSHSYTLCKASERAW